MLKLQENKHGKVIKNKLKRTKIGSDSEDESCGVDSFSRFMAINSKDTTKPLNILSPLVIDKDNCEIDWYTSKC